jgi:hypothetical protein
VCYISIAPGISPGREAHMARIDDKHPTVKGCPHALDLRAAFCTGWKRGGAR